LGILDNVQETDPELGILVRNDPLMEAIERELPLLASRYDRRQIPDLKGSWRSTLDNIWSRLDGACGRVPPAIELPKKSGSRGFGLSPEKVREKKAEQATAEFAAKIRDRVAPQRGTGISLSNGPITDLILSPGFWRSDSHSGGYSLHAQRPAGSFALRLDNGSWAAGAVYADFYGTLTQDEYGIASYVLRSRYEESTTATSAVARAATGQLLGQPYDVAAELRETKHIDPVYGALAAYIYARASETDEIRRLLYFYGELGQPAPFDAVLLARVPVERGPWGWVARVPAVPARTPRSRIESERSFTFEATPAIYVHIAGGFPWLRQGWALLEDDFRPSFRHLYRLAKGLVPSTFTTFRPAFGEQIRSLISKGEL
jgi:hypothetical protein